ncbi:MAG: type II toxin-antitoxin system PemK/MazF family toxin [Chlamydiae bacterium]|nr:type II toxin-antitoxin system PemK/MazF family toxin [Chlamydiota bacterium]MBI3265664.1 type II toxin-antitoxin system PemK/MazF family toxin [Chlamydiota bacterium]
MLRYVPCKGDLVILTFDPQAGHEQKGRRPALIVSNDLFNQRTGFAIACPITNTDRKIPFHVKIHPSSSLTGFVMVDQVKSIDYRTRQVKYVEQAPIELLEDVLSILDACLF